MSQEIAQLSDAPIGVVVQAAKEEWFYEGVEKLLEIWFDKSSPDQSLRLIPRIELEKIMEIAHCEIVSEMHNDMIDSYVLSESSCFISSERIILKTCGTTRLMDTIELIKQLASKYANMDNVVNVFYSRKNFRRPDLQYTTHRNFDTETEFMDGIFKDGSAYCLGSLKQDRWYLYTLNPPRGHMAKSDQTLEILMQDLDRRVMDIFTEQRCKDGKEATKLARIADLMPPNTTIDDKLFSPCGYSMNGIINGTDHYVTIHVTPEPAFSYVSFETNQNQECFFEQTVKTLKCFRPGHFILTVFANRASTNAKQAQKHIWNRQIPGYKRSGLQFLLLPEHTLVYAQYIRRETVPADTQSDSGLSDDSES